MDANKIVEAVGKITDREQLKLIRKACEIRKAELDHKESETLMSGKSVPLSVDVLANPGRDAS